MRRRRARAAHGPHRSRGRRRQPSAGIVAVVVVGGQGVEYRNCQRQCAQHQRDSSGCVRRRVSVVHGRLFDKQKSILARSLCDNSPSRKFNVLVTELLDACGLGEVRFAFAFDISEYLCFLLDFAHSLHAPLGAANGGDHAGRTARRAAPARRAHRAASSHTPRRARLARHLLVLVLLLVAIVDDGIGIVVVININVVEQVDGVAIDDDGDDVAQCVAAGCRERRCNRSKQQTDNNDRTKDEKRS